MSVIRNGVMAGPTIACWATRLCLGFSNPSLHARHDAGLDQPCELRRFDMEGVPGHLVNRHLLSRARSATW